MNEQTEKKIEKTFLALMEEKDFEIIGKDMDKLLEKQ